MIKTILQDSSSNWCHPDHYFFLKIKLDHTPTPSILCFFSIAFITTWTNHIKISSFRKIVCLLPPECKLCEGKDFGLFCLHLNS